MANNATNYLENKVLDHVLGQTVRDYISPTLYVGLFTDDSVVDIEAGTGTEPTGGAYVRKPVTFGAASAGSATNSGAVTFDAATADWGLIEYAGIFDAESGGNALFVGQLTVSKTVTNGDTFQISTGQLTVSLN